jgi:hypothetical protein
MFFRGAERKEREKRAKKRLGKGERGNVIKKWKREFI